MNYYKTGKFARLANVSERTIRYYDKIGLLKPSFVMENGYRQYSDLDLLKLQKILSLKHLGFSIEEIFPMVMDNTNLKESFELQIDLIEDKIRHLQSLKDALKRASQSSNLSWNMILSLVQLSNEETNIIEQYKNAKNLNDRISLHEKYSTNKQGWFNWLFEKIDFSKVNRLLELGCGNGKLWQENKIELRNSYRILVKVWWKRFVINWVLILTVLWRMLKRYLLKMLILIPSLPIMFCFI